jgi:hypothetical protein
VLFESTGESTVENEKAPHLPSRKNASLSACNAPRNASTPSKALLTRLSPGNRAGRKPLARKCVLTGTLLREPFLNWDKVLVRMSAGGERSERSRGSHIQGNGTIPTQDIGMSAIF